MEQYTGTAIDLSDISFVDEQFGWAGGYQYLSPGGESRIFYTSDGGMTWSEQSVMPDVGIAWMEFINEDDGFLLAGIDNGLDSDPAIFQTFDGGMTWSQTDFEMDEYSYNDNLYKGCIVEDQDIWLAGENSRILHSDDQGANWTDQVEVLSTYILEDVQFLNLNEGWATGGFSLLHTANGGQDWQSVVPDTFTEQWTSLSFSDNQNGWVAGSKVIHTTNGGQDWEEQVLPIDIGVQKIRFTSPTHGWIIGYGNQVLRTTNGGHDWAAYNNFPSINFKDIHFVDSQTGWIVGGNSIVNTSNGGQSWSTYELDGYPDIRSIHFSDPLNGWALGFGSSGLYFRTQDGGQTWQEHTIP